MLDDATHLRLLMRHEFAAFEQAAITILLGSSAPDALLWHVRAMANVIQEIADGEMRRLIVTVPPRHLKSTVATVAQIAWRLGRNPALKILLVSYSKELSKDLLG